MQYLFPHQEIIDNINNSRLCLILQVLTPSHRLLRSSNSPLSSGCLYTVLLPGPEKQGRPLKEPLSMPTTDVGAWLRMQPQSMFQEHCSHLLVSRVEVQHGERRRILECLGKFTRGSASRTGHGVCACLPAMHFAHQEDCALYDIWQSYPFLFVKIHAVLVL